MESKIVIKYIYIYIPPLYICSFPHIYTFFKLKSEHIIVCEIKDLQNICQIYLHTLLPVITVYEKDLNFFDNNDNNIYIFLS